MVKYQGSLYIGTFDVAGGVQMLVEESDCYLSCFVLRILGEHADFSQSTPGFDLLRFESPDEPAIVLTKNGYGNGSNNGIRNAMVIDGKLFFGTSTYSNLDVDNGGWELFQLSEEM